MCAATLLFSCGTNSNDSHFARMQDGHIQLGDEAFFPLTINYAISLHWDGKGLHAGSYDSYHPDRPPLAGDQALEEIRAEFKLMRAMGFNSTRLVQLTEGPRLEQDRTTHGIVVRTLSGRDTTITIENEERWNEYLDVVAGVLALAREAGLKVILLTTIHPENPASPAHFVRIAERFREDPTILAFDLFNEPLYFDSVGHTKSEVRAIVKGWRELVKEHAPRHLFTIGLSGIREVHAWDPDLLDVDFISFHPYEYEPDQVRNEIRWYREHVHKPWMIGETSLPADGDSVSYADQVVFARRTMEQVRACGGIGYSWWQFMDVRWGNFHSDHMGVLHLDGSTTVDGAVLPVMGVPKPVAEVFRSFDPRSPVGECLDLPNYWNYSGHRTARLTGRLIDPQGNPIEGGVILGWDRLWGKSFHSITRQNGTFELSAPFYLHHWMVSATGWSTTRGDVEPNSYRRAKDGVPEGFLGDIVVEPLIGQ